MINQELVQALGALQDHAPSHSFDETRRIIEDSLGMSIDEVFETIDPEPIASGTVAQVHRARLRGKYAIRRGRNGERNGERDDERDGERDGEKFVEVAVKVRHPAVMQETFVDVAFIYWAVNLVPFIQLEVPFKQEEFTMSLFRQFDLKGEAYNMARFASNFKQEVKEGFMSFPKVRGVLLLVFPPIYGIQYTVYSVYTILRGIYDTTSCYEGLY